MVSEEQRPLVADSLEFSKLRPEILEGLRIAEREFRRIIREGIVAKFPEHLARTLEAVVTEVPADFIRAMLPMFTQYSELRDFAEIIEKSKGFHARGGRPGMN